MASLQTRVMFPCPVRYMDVGPIQECLEAFEMYEPSFLHSAQGATGIQFGEEPPYELLKELVTHINGLSDRMPLTWAAAVKQWNQHQIFKEDMYAIPKKGSEGYKEVKDEIATSKGKEYKSQIVFTVPSDTPIFKPLTPLKDYHPMLTLEQKNWVSGIVFKKDPPIAILKQLVIDLNKLKNQQPDGWSASLTKTDNYDGYKKHPYGDSLKIIY